MKILKGFFILNMMFLFWGSGHAVIYKWTDSQGTVHYSDIPGPGAKIINLPEFQMGAPPPSTGTAAGEEGKPPVGNSSYEKLAIVQPEDKATIRNPQGYVLVNIEVDPQLQNGDLLQMVIDGNPFGKPQASPGFAINNLERGSHKLSARIVNVNGDSVMTSDEIEIYMMPPRVNMVPQANKPNASGGSKSPPP